MPRVIKFTPEKCEAIIRALRLGNYLSVAARYAGVGKRTLYGWLSRGRKDPDSEYGRFRAEVLKTQAAVEARAVGLWFRRCEDDWKAAARFLERKFPGRWRQQSLRLSSRTEGGPRKSRAQSDPAAAAARALQIAELLAAAGAFERLPPELSAPLVTETAESTDGEKRPESATATETSDEPSGGLRRRRRA